MSNQDLNKIMRDTIFAVKFDNETQEIDFIKKELNPVVQASLETFLRTYLRKCDKLRDDDLVIDYGE